MKPYLISRCRHRTMSMQDWRIESIKIESITSLVLRSRRTNRLVQVRFKPNTLTLTKLNNLNMRTKSDRVSYLCWSVKLPKMTLNLTIHCEVPTATILLFLQSKVRYPVDSCWHLVTCRTTTNHSASEINHWVTNYCVMIVLTTPSRSLWTHAVLQGKM